MANGINLLELRAIPELCNKNFFIPDYQRGYRWGTRQVEQLMSDLSEFFGDGGKGDFYCLQPVVVKKMDDKIIQELDIHSGDDNNTWYEVIDGQQRLTTIRIIFALEHLMNPRINQERFTISYKTRPSLTSIFDELKFNESDRNDLYGVYVDNEDNLDIDSWHILQAARCIMNWVKNGEQSNHGLKYFTGLFYDNFTHKPGNDDKSVQVIWYELRDGSDPNRTFKRLNDKKIPLNNSELIHGLFLSESAKYEFDERLLQGYSDEILRKKVREQEQTNKQLHIVEMWDIIERQLRQPDFWAFVSKDNSDMEWSCRIEYLFDLIAGKKGDEKDELFTYLRFEEMVRNHDVAGLWELWQKVESCFSALQSWFRDREYYHKIGFLIAEQGREVLVDLLHEVTTKKTSEFKKGLDWRIKVDITGKSDGDVDIYKFNYTDNSNQLFKILFYFNVESTRLAKNQSYFPFHLYKEGNWTLEHIHAQNSEKIDRSDKKKWTEWYTENIQALEHLCSRFDEEHEYNPRNLISSLNNSLKILYRDDFVFDNFTKDFDSVTAYYNNMAIKEGGSPEIHDISNLALLTSDLNSGISNSVFEVKRQKMMDYDAEGRYVPYCTRLVFLKYYNRNEQDFCVQQTFYWSEKDRNNYLNRIKEVLSTVLSTKNPNPTDK